MAKKQQPEEEVPPDIAEGFQQFIEMVKQLQQGMKESSPEMYRQMMESASKGQQR